MVVVVVVLMILLMILLTLILRRNRSISQRAAMVRVITIVGRAYAIQVAYLIQHHEGYGYVHGQNHRHHHYYSP